MRKTFAVVSLSLLGFSGCTLGSTDIEGTGLAGTRGAIASVTDETAPVATPSADAPARQASADATIPATDPQDEGTFPPPTQTTPIDTTPPAPEDAYYAVVLGADVASGDRSRAHTFATFLHVRMGVATTPTSLTVDPEGTIEERVDIGWLPAGYSGQVTTPRCGTFGEIICFWVGKNSTLEESMDLMRRTQKSVTAYGPRSISKDAFSRARARRDVLASGRIGFLPFDSSYHRQAYEGTGGAANAVHAISDAGDYLLGDAVPGAEGARRAIDAFGPAMGRREARAEWLMPRLGLVSGVARAD